VADIAAAVKIPFRREAEYAARLMRGMFGAGVERVIVALPRCASRFSVRLGWALAGRVAAGVDHFNGKCG